MNPRAGSPDEIFFAALEIASPEGRAAYLDLVCGTDLELRRRIERLLDAQPNVGSFLDAPAVGPTLTFGPLPGLEAPGTVIGPYTLLEPIGEGGMGVVYRAEQTHPVRREVALKIIKPGMDTRQVIARFEAERQALALMDHSNIARVLDAGATEGGRPYFVMELVKGHPITDYCDAHHLSLDDRLGLFVSVCQAVQHAHQKGIIHRDLKPTNIIVTLQDGVPIPKVIDFGIAKATGQSLTDKTLFTACAQLVGTPLYMSPEQAAMSGLDVDTRTDIYSLGVLVYELLTSTTPFDGATFRTAALGEIQRIIREEEPPRPSTRLSTLGDTLTTVSANRQADPRKLPHSIRGELDWIVMKALEKDRTRRYATAGDFAADVTRYRTDQPVEACTPSTWYRFAKYARRNRMALTTAAMVAAAMLVGTAVSAWQAVRATHAEAIANANEAKARAAARNERATREAEARQRRRAEDIAEQGRRRQVRLNVDQGTRLVNDGDLAGALRYFVEALRLDAGDPVRVADHRVRLGMLLAGCAKPVRIWFRDALNDPVAFRPDGGAVAIARDDGTITVRDTGTGLPLGPVVKQRLSWGSLAFSPDGQRIAIACDDAAVRLIDVASGRETVPPLRQIVGCRYLRFSPDGTLLLTSRETRGRIWNAESGQPMTDWLEFGSQTVGACFSEDSRLVAVPAHRDFRVYEARTGRPVLPPTSCTGMKSWVMILPRYGFSPDARRIVTSSLDHNVRVWDTSTGALVTPPIKHTHRVEASFSPDGRHVLSWCWDGAVRIWDAATGALTCDPMRHPGVVYAATFSPDGALVVTYCADSAVRVWDFKIGRLLLPPLWHLGPVKKLWFSSDGRCLLTWSADGALRVWDLAAAAPMGPRLPGGGFGACAEFDRDGRLAVTSGNGGTVHVWDTTTGLPSGSSVSLPARSLHAAEISPDSRSFALVDARADHGSTAWVWDLATRRVRVGPLNLEHQFVANGIPLIAWSPDGRRVAVAASTGNNNQASGAVVRIWDVQAGAPVAPVLSYDSAIYSLEFSPDGRSLVTASNEVRILDAGSGALRIDPIRFPGTERTLARHSPDGHRLLIVIGRLKDAFAGNDIQVWDHGTGRPLSPRVHVAFAVKDAFFTREGSRFITVSGDAVRVWDAATLALTGMPMRSALPIDSGSLSLDDRRLLVTCAGMEYSKNPGFAQVVDLATGWPVTPPLWHEQSVLKARFSRDGSRLVTTSAEGGALLWNLVPDNRPLEDLVRVAQVLSGSRVDDSGASIPITTEELREAYQSLRNKDPETFAASRAQVIGWHYQQRQGF